MLESAFIFSTVCLAEDLKFTESMRQCLAQDFCFPWQGLTFQSEESHYLKKSCGRPQKETAEVVFLGLHQVFNDILM